MFLTVRSLGFCPRPLHSHQEPQRVPHPLQEVGATAQARPLESECGRMADSAPNTVYEPKLANFFSYMDPEHKPISTPDSHHNFPCHDDATVISTTEDPEGLPHSGASTAASKQQLAEFPNVRTLKPLETGCMSCVGSFWRKLGQCRTENLLRQRFLVHSRKGKYIETQTLCIR